MNEQTDSEARAAGQWAPDSGGYQPTENMPADADLPTSADTIDAGEDGEVGHRIMVDTPFETSGANPCVSLSVVSELTEEQYDKAIEALQNGKTQLQPDGRCCAVCGDGGHGAWECHHNPLAMMLEAQHCQGSWRCFHCDTVFTDADQAREHFGANDMEPAACTVEEASAVRR